MPKINLLSICTELWSGFLRATAGLRLRYRTLARACGARWGRLGAWLLASRLAATIIHALVKIAPLFRHLEALTARLSGALAMTVSRSVGWLSNGVHRMMSRLGRRVFPLVSRYSDHATDFAAAIAQRSLNPRQKLVGAVAVVSLTSVVGAIATVDGAAGFVTTHAVEQALSIQATTLGNPAEAMYWYEERMGRGDTFASLLARLQVRGVEVNRVLGDATAARIMHKLRTDTAVHAQVNGSGELQQIEFVTAEDRLAKLVRAEGAKVRWVATERPLPMERHTVSSSVTIRSGLSADAEHAGIPGSVVAQLPQAFGDVLAVSSGLHRGDQVSTLYETFWHEGEMIRPGRLLAAEVTQGRNSQRVVWFDGTRGYYTAQGRSVLATPGIYRLPVDGAKITTGFAAHVGPTGQQWVTHKGIDYAVPMGTPIHATGDGTIDFVGWQGGYGNVVVVRHPSDYTTLYAHMSQFSPSARPGLRVNEGQVLGFVGMTGWSTGPHVHYEFRHHGVYMNPATASLARNRELSTRQIAQLQTEARALFAQMEGKTASVAQLD